MEVETITAAPELPARRVPVLSLKAYIAGSDRQQQRFVDQFFHGIKDYGFIILRDHEIDESLFIHAYQLIEQFFALPIAAKMRYAQVHGGQRGYTPFGQEHAKDSAVMDLKEFWHVGRQVDGSHRLSTLYPDNVWPTEIPEFKPVMEKLYFALERAGRSLLQALTAPLGLPLWFFDDMVLDGNSILRLLHYPPIPPGTDQHCLRSAPHEDINLITILPSATASGLQLKDRDGQWLDVNAEPGTLIVDAGDMLARLTNEVIPSTTHQVINVPGAATTSRYSMPFFMHPHPEAMLTCLPACRGEGAKYADISAHDFLMQRLREIGLIRHFRQQKPKTRID